MPGIQNVAARCGRVSRVRPASASLPGGRSAGRTPGSGGLMMRMRSRRARILAWTSLSMVAILVVVAAGAYAAFRLELSGITHVSKIDAQRRPPRYTNALNILLLGS